MTTRRAGPPGAKRAVFLLMRLRRWRSARKRREYSVTDDVEAAARPRRQIVGVESSRRPALGVSPHLRRSSRFARFSAAAFPVDVVRNQRASIFRPLDTSGYPSRVGMASGFRPDTSPLANKILVPKIRYRSAIDPTERACGRRPCHAISPCVQLVARFAGEQRTLGASKMMVYRLHLYSLINRDEVFSSFQIARKLYS